MGSTASAGSDVSAETRRPTLGFGALQRSGANSAMQAPRDAAALEMEGGAEAEGGGAKGAADDAAPDGHRPRLRGRSGTARDAKEGACGDAVDGGADAIWPSDSDITVIRVRRHCRPRSERVGGGAGGGGAGTRRSGSDTSTLSQRRPDANPSMVNFATLVRQGSRAWQRGPRHRHPPRHQRPRQRQRHRRDRELLVAISSWGRRHPPPPTPTPPPTPPPPRAADFDVLFEQTQWELESPPPLRTPSPARSPLPAASPTPTPGGEAPSPPPAPLPRGRGRRKASLELLDSDASDSAPGERRGLRAVLRAVANLCACRRPRA